MHGIGDDRNIQDQNGCGKEIIKQQSHATAVVSILPFIFYN